MPLQVRAQKAVRRLYETLDRPKLLWNGPEALRVMQAILEEERESAYRDSAKWCCLKGYDTKIPQVEEIRQKILAEADKLLG